MTEWAIRIVGHGEKPADQFTANPDNARLHPPAQRAAMKAALDTLGWIAPVIENKRTGYLVDGHERVMQALLTNATVPYVEVDLDEAEEKLALATYDPIGAMAQYDQQLLDNLLREVDTAESALQMLLSNLASHSGLVQLDAYKEWDGMPEFNNPDATAPYTISVHFYTEDDLLEFGNLIGQIITTKTRYINFPYIPDENLKAHTVSHGP